MDNSRTLSINHSGNFLAALVAFLLVVSCGLFIPSHAQAQTNYVPADSATIALVSDGTHDGPGTETYLRSEYGYDPADNNAKDGVVSSGDVVVYRVTINLVAGPARTLTLSFAQNDSDSALNIADFSKLSIGGGVISGKWDSNKKAWIYSVPRGATGSVQGTVAVRANDTRGVAVPNNKVKLELVENGFVSASEPVTVISAPMADLTIQANFGSGNPAMYYGPELTSRTGSFSLVPKMISPKGFSSNGATAGTAWKTDVDVSEFPSGTTWMLGDQSIVPDGAILKDLTGTGIARLSYTLPLEAMPTSDEQLKTYTISLNVHPDSFSAGDLKNVPDPGNGQPINYRTSSYTQTSSVTGEQVEFNALDGVNAKNNNFSVVNWSYSEPAVPGPKPLWDYRIDHPFEDSQTAFEEGNLYWHDDSPWYSQVRNADRYARTKRPLTWDNDLSHRLIVLASNLSCEDATGNSCVADSSQVVVGDEITPYGENDGSYRPHYYDSTRNAVVLVGGAPLDGSKYVTEWKVGNRWIATDRAPAGANASRVSFSADAFQIGAGAPNVEVVWPAKAYDYASGKYLSPDDNGHSISSTGSLTISGESPETKRDQVALIFPQTPAASAKITVDAVPPRNDDGSFTTTWHVDNRALSPVSTTGNSARTVLTLDDVFDVSSFKLTNDAGWRVEGYEGNQVTLVTDKPMLSAADNESWSLGKFSFQVNTHPYLFDPSLSLKAGINEDLTLNYPQVGDLPAGQASADSSATTDFSVSAVVSSRISTDVGEAEIDDQVSWTAYISAGYIGDDDVWRQEIRLPRNDDISYMDQVNATNEENISIDPETGLDTSGIYGDGIGRSKFDGSYQLSTLRIENANASTTVTFYNKSADGTRIDVVKRTVNPDGTVDLNGVEDRAFFELSAKGNASATQQAGATVHFGIDTEGNEEGNDYVAWLSPLEVPGSTPAMPWPDDAKIVMSEISGTVWQDENDDTNLDVAEPRHAGVSVTLEREIDGVWSPVATTTTATDGSYKFEQLHSGTYRVTLPNVTRGDGRTVSTINGDSRGKDGETLAASAENRFGVWEATEQTRSYLATNATSASNAQVKLGMDSHIENVDFGYLVPRVDLALDKSPARLSSTSTDDEYVNVSWDVTITNTGNRPIQDLKLSDRTSKEVQGIQATTSYLTEWNDITGTPIAATGASPTAASGSGVATTDGYWIVKPDGTAIQGVGLTGTPIALTGNSPTAASGGSGVATSDGYWIVKSDGTAVKVAAITGTTIAVTGASPTSSSGSGVLTTDGYWLVDAEGEAIKVDGIVGTPIALTGESPIGSGGSLVATDQGVWLVEYSQGTQPTATKITGLTGTPIALTGTKPATNNSYGFGIATTDGYWMGNKASVAKAGANSGVPITGTPIAITGTQPRAATTGSAIITTEGYWSIGANTQPFKANGIAGIPVAVTGDAPRRLSSNKGLAGVLTNEGYWLVRSDNSTYKVEEITGTPVDLLGKYPASNLNAGSAYRSGSGVLTSDGYWIVTPSSGDDYTASAVQAEGITGNPIDATGTQPLVYGSAVATSDGYWLVNADGVTTKVGQHVETVAGQSLVVSQPSVSERAFDRDWVRRSYDLPTLLPGEKIVVTLSGTVAKDRNPLVVGNQAWVTSEMTPRGGMETVSDTALQMTVSGAGMESGVPDIPELPTPDEVNNQLDGITGTATVSLNPAGRDIGKVDDLADQTPALIAPNPDADLSGSVGGTVWYDNSLGDDDKATESDGLRAGSDTDTTDPNREERVVGMKVSVRNLDGILLAETTTDDNGRWIVDRLPAGIDVDVQYEAFGWSHDGVTWTPVTQSQRVPTTAYDGTDTSLPIPGDPNSAKDSDADATGYISGENRLVTTNANTPYGWADLGLKVLDSGIALVKGGTDDYAEGQSSTTNPIELDQVRGDRELEATAPQLNPDLPLKAVDAKGRMFDGDNDPRTQAYGFNVLNLGQSDLTNITLQDVTTSGNQALLGKAIEITRTDGSIETGQLVDQQVQLANATPVTLKVGESLRGYFHVAFSDPDANGEDLHVNQMNVNAQALSPQGDVIGVVNDNDPFSSSYKYAASLSLKLRKVSAEQSVGGGYDTGLAFASLQVDATDLLELPTIDDQNHVLDEIGTFSSDTDGYFTLENIPAGIYRITETVAPYGYLLPKGVWYFQLRYNDSGDPDIEVRAIGDQPYAQASEPNAEDQNLWGQLELTNTPVFTPPLTGGSAWIIIAAGIITVVGGGFLMRRGWRASQDI